MMELQNSSDSATTDGFSGAASRSPSSGFSASVVIGIADPVAVSAYPRTART
jgi:hypothetical protein